MAKEKRLIDTVDEAIKRYAEHGDILQFISDVRFAVINAPTVDVVEVVHGRWEYFDDEECGLHRCSCCCGSVGYPTNYCPNCGAKMDGERRVGE